VLRGEPRHRRAGRAGGRGAEHRAGRRRAARGAGGRALPGARAGDGDAVGAAWRGRGADDRVRRGGRRRGLAAIRSAAPGVRGGRAPDRAGAAGRLEGGSAMATSSAARPERSRIRRINARLNAFADHPIGGASLVAGLGIIFAPIASLLFHCPLGDGVGGAIIFGSGWGATRWLVRWLFPPRPAARESAPMIWPRTPDFVLALVVMAAA